MRRYISIGTLIIFGFCLCWNLPAQESTSTGEEELFGSSDEDSSGGLFEEVEDEELASSLEKELLTSERVEIGGTYTFSLASSWMWGVSGSYENVLETDLRASIYFDARPDENFRVFGKTNISYPFSENAAEERSFDDIITITELFSDFNIKDRVFFRGGKHTINWGVGYFFSPADIINLTPIDPKDPEAEREGPVSLKVNIPIGIHNLYMYSIVDEITKPYEIAIAPKAEFVLGDMEVGIGAFYQKDRAPAGMITATTSFRDFDLFGEGVVSYGADKRFIEETAVSPEYPFGLMAVDRDDEFFFSGTVGFRYSNLDDTGNFNITLTGQYLYNGYGYKDPDFLKDNEQGIGFLIGADKLSIDDLSSPGQHYGASLFNWRSMFDTDLSIKLFWMGNLTDGSGKIIPEFLIQPIDELEISVGVPVTYGEEGDQFTPDESTVSVSLQFSLGCGRF